MGGHQQDTARWRHHAKALRTTAELIVDEETRARYLRMADAYEALADSEAPSAHTTVTAKPNM